MFMISRGFMTSLPSDTNCELVWVMPRSPWKLWKAILFSNSWLNHRGKSTEGRGPVARRHHGWSIQLPASRAAVKEWGSKAMEWCHQRCSASSVPCCPEFTGSVLWILWLPSFSISCSGQTDTLFPMDILHKLLASTLWTGTGLQVNEDTHLYEHSQKA